MRPVDNQWRSDPYDQPNDLESAINILNKYELTEEDNKHIEDYDTKLFFKYASKKCSTACNKQNEDFNNCFSNCFSKLLESTNLFNQASLDYDAKLSH